MINKNKMDIDGIGNTTAGRDYNDYRTFINVDTSPIRFLMKKSKK